jgi:sugar phosphate permease
VDGNMNFLPRRKLLRIRWLIFSIMALAYVSSFFHRVCPAVVALDIQESFGISAPMVGLLASAYFYGYALIQFPGGLLADSLGPRKTVSLFMLLAGVGSIGLGLASGLGEAVIGRLLVGVGAGMVFAPTMKMISEWFTIREFPLMNSLFLLTGGIGALTAATPLALITSWLGWRSAFEIMGVASVFLAILVWSIVRDRPQDMGLPSLAEVDPVYGAGIQPPRQISLWSGAQQVFGNRHFWPIAAWSSGSLGIFFGFGGLWAGPYFMHNYGMSRAEAGDILNMLAVGIILGSPLMSFLSNKVFRSRKKVLMLSAGLLLAELVFLNYYPAGLPRILLYPLILCFAMFSLTPAVISVTSAKELFPVEITGTSVGAVNLFPFLGGALLQVAIGWLLDWYPLTQSGDYSPEAYSAMFKLFLIVALGTLFSTFFMKETFPEAHREYNA